MIDLAAKPAIFKREREECAFDKGEIRTRGIFDALSDDQFVIVQAADNRLDLLPQFSRGAQAPMAKGSLIATRHGAG